MTKISLNLIAASAIATFGLTLFAGGLAIPDLAAIGAYAWPQLPYGVLGLAAWLLRKDRASSFVIFLGAVAICGLGAWTLIDSLFLSPPDAQGALVFLFLPAAQLVLAFIFVLGSLIAGQVDRGSKPGGDSGNGKTDAR